MKFPLFLFCPKPVACFSQSYLWESPKPVAFIKGLPCCVTFDNELKIDMRHAFSVANQKEIVMTTSRKRIGREEPRRRKRIHRFTFGAIARFS